MSLKDDEVKLEAIELAKNGYNKTEIGNILGIPSRTVQDFFAKNTHVGWWESFDRDSPKAECLKNEVNKNMPVPTKTKVYSIATSPHKPDGCTHLFIPDTQCKPGIDMSYLSWIGKYIVDRRPDVIIHIGDHADMPSLSSYDKGKRTAEGKRVSEDIEAAIQGMNLLLKPLHDLQQQELKEYGKILYKPRMVLTLGNHEQRISRHVDANPELYGFLSYEDLKYNDMGWEVFDFLEPAIINGVTYCHFMPNPMTGKPYGGTVQNILKHVGESFSMGHKQCLEVATRFLPASGKQQWAIVAGAAYPHDEDYKGYQGNHHFRGIVVKNRVIGGGYDPEFISLTSLESFFDEER